MGFECYGTGLGAPHEIAAITGADRNDFDGKMKRGVGSDRAATATAARHSHHVHFFLGVWIAIKVGIGFFENFRNDFVTDLAFRFFPAEVDR